jgi:hypothetical protein
MAAVVACRWCCTTDWVRASLTLRGEALAAGGDPSGLFFAPEEDYGFRQSARQWMHQLVAFDASILSQTDTARVKLIKAIIAYGGAKIAKSGMPVQPHIILVGEKDDKTRLAVSSPELIDAAAEGAARVLTATELWDDVPTIGKTLSRRRESGVAAGSPEKRPRLAGGAPAAGCKPLAAT